jgi:hypothetical protein
MINILRSNGIAVIVDMDDDMSTIHPENGAYHMYRTTRVHRSPGSTRPCPADRHHGHHVHATVGQGVRRSGRGRVLDNYIPEKLLDMPSFPIGTFGWAGTTKSHPNDPQVTAPTAEKLVSEGHTFQIVGGDEKPPRRSGSSTSHR